jgi:hypothetical protein
LCWCVSLSFAQPTSTALKPAEVQSPPLASFDDAKTVEDMARVRRREVQATIKFVDAADMEPIEGVRVVWFGPDQVSNRDGIIVIDAPSDRGAFVGLDTRVILLDLSQMQLSKLGKPVDTSKLALPRAIRLPLASHPVGVPLDPITIPLQFDGVTMRGKVDVDTSALELSEISRERLQQSTVVSADVLYKAGSRLCLPSEEVVLGPIPRLVDRGFVRAGTSFFPVKLAENFDVRIALEKSAAIVCVEMSDVVQLHRIAEKHAVSEISGATLIRVTDGYASSFYRTPFRSLGPVDVRVPPGKYVVVPGALSGCTFHLPVFDAIFDGIDVTKFGLTTIEIEVPQQAQVELPRLTVQASVMDAIRSIEAIEQELVKQKTAKLNQAPRNEQEPKATDASRTVVPAPPLASFDDAKTVEDIARVPRRGVQVTMKFVDAADDAPIEGVRIKVWGMEYTSDHDGFIVVDRSADRGGFVGLDACALFRDRSEMTLLKRGKPLDTSKFVAPRVVKLPLGKHPIDARLEPMTIRLQFDGVMVQGKVEVDASGAALSEHLTWMLPRSTLCVVDLNYQEGTKQVHGSEEVIVGPLPKVVTRGFINALSDFIPVQLGEQFDVRVVLEKKTAIVCVEMPDAFQLLRVSQEHACREISGATLIRVTDGYASSFTRIPPHTYGPVDVYVPSGKYVVVPGALSGCTFHLPVFDAIFAGIDVTKFGLTTIEIEAPQQAQTELPRLTVQASVMDAIRSVEAIEQEVAKHNAAKGEHALPKERQQPETLDAK